MPAAADILSTLPEPLLGLILSKIPIREAVRCSVLSKRWRFLYAQIPRLTLSPFLLLGSVEGDPFGIGYQDPDPLFLNPDPLFLATVEKIIFNLLLLHSSDLEAFHLFNYISQCGHKQGNRYFSHSVCGDDESKWHFTHQSVSQWVRYASSKNVQSLILCPSPWKSPVKEILPPALFSCTCLNTLRLSNYILTYLPPHFSGFNHLMTCSFRGMEFTDESLSRFISHTPFLENLSILDYVGLTKPIISSPNLKHLSIGGVEMEGFTINCPKIRTLNLFVRMGSPYNPVLIMIHDLQINGALFHELSFSVDQIQWEGYIVELWLNLRGKPSNLSADRFLEIVGTFKTLKALYIANWSLLERERQMVGVVDKLFERLPALERLQVEEMFDLELVRDPMLPCTDSLLDNLLKVKVSIYQLDKGEIAVIGKLLESASALEIMEVELSEIHLNYELRKSFMKRLVYLRRASIRARISVKEFEEFEDI